MHKAYDKETFYSQHDNVAPWTSQEVFFPYFDSTGKSRKHYSSKNMYSRVCRVTQCNDCGMCYAIVNDNKRIFIKYVWFPKYKGGYICFNRSKKLVVQ